MTMALKLSPPARMTLASLLPELTAADYANLQISGLQLDSRQLRRGELFVALRGEVHHGLEYANNAIGKGAVGIIVEADDPMLGKQDFRVEVIPIQNLHERLPELASRFYGQQIAAVNLIGVTGTNGKTTCSQLIARALTDLGKPCGLIGTLGIGFAENLQTLDKTTPDLLTLYRGLADLSKSGAQFIAMEVSSHALDQQRCDGLQFDTAILTNLSRDHLDYHGSMEAYAATKRQLFEMPGLRSAILNGDDALGQQLSGSLATVSDKLIYSLQSRTADVHASDIVHTVNGLSATIHTPWGTGRLHSQLIGDFNLSNQLAVICLLGSHGLSLDSVLDVLSQLAPVDGRMQKFGGDGGPSVIVDYAHTPDALTQVLRALRPHCPGQIWCVFGCGGNRDRGKRALMGSIAAQLADHVVVTSDNPRNEDADEIIDDIVAGITGPVTRLTDRAEAISSTVLAAGDEDLILIAGKGHENYQELNAKRLPFNDTEQVQAALTKRGGQL